MINKQILAQIHTILSYKLRLVRSLVQGAHVHKAKIFEAYVFGCVSVRAVELLTQVVI